MDLSRHVNGALRHTQAVVQALRNFQPNKRFINLNLFIGALLFIIFAQQYFMRGIKTSSKSLVMLNSDAHHSVYDSLLRDFSTDEFDALPLGQKCDAFFEHMSAADPAWKLDNYDTEGYDDDYINFQDFLKTKQAENPSEKFDEKHIIELEKAFYEKTHTAVKIDQRINDAIATLRIFGKCYFEDSTAGSSRFGFTTNIFNDNAGTESLKGAKASPEQCSGLEARIFPWLSTRWPVFTRWDGTNAETVPDLTAYAEDYDEYSANGAKNKEKRDASDPNCFLTSFKKSINGRGYVISASDGQVDELMRLALVLRSNGNTLPIQIVHKGDLSKENIKKLTSQFRDEISPTAMPKSFNDLGMASGLQFPAQEVWYVNVEPCIREGFEDYFQKYANKLLAYMFNSFDEMILIDTDTVPFVKLEEIFKYPDYIATGAYFFKDRQLRGQNTENSVNYFTRLMPSKLDNYFFDVPMATDFTLKNRFMGGRRNHYMESGVVAIKRSSHFTGMLISTQLNFWTPTLKKVHGDKELFWLGQSIAGNEQYAFNIHGAASIGELTALQNRRFPNSQAQELCSNHPGHISGYDNQTLLWINSGLTFCKHTNAAEFDHGKPLFRDYDQSRLEKYYQQKTTIRSAIVPPPQEVEAVNEAANPDSGWSDEHKYCMSYTWCAVDFVGYNEKPEERGLLVNFDAQQTRWFDFIGDVWMDGFREK